MRNFWTRLKRWVASTPEELPTAPLDTQPEAQPEPPAESGPTPPAATEPDGEDTPEVAAPESAAGAAGGAEAEIVAERLAEDEALRGYLTDDAYDPLLNGVTNLTVARAPAFSTTDELHQAARDLLAAAVDVASSGDGRAVEALPDTPLLAGPQKAAILSALEGDAEGAVGRGVAIGAILEASAATTGSGEVS